ncbi:MAG: hypothetical protein RIQ81_1876 [Pseudomonadota bacterium]
MKLEQLTQEQVHSMTLREKDEWWLKNVYKGDMPQLTLRSALTGMILGGVLSLTNLYVGIKTGWTLGVGITSVILAFAFFKVLSKINLGNELTILENNAMQSIATSAGYMTGPLVSSIAAYMLVTNQFIPMSHTMIWITLLSILGVLFAFPLKKRFINDEQLPFPEGRAAGVVMANLHTGDGKDGVLKAKILGVGAGLSALIEGLRDHGFMERIHAKWAAIPEHWDDFLYSANSFVQLKLMGTPLKDLTIRWETSIVMLATGGLMGVKTGASMLAGGIINYFILVPYLLDQGIIASAKFKEITMWSLWPGVAMMTTASLYSFFSKPKVLLSAFSGMFGGKGGQNKEEDILKDIELPMWVFAVGIPVLGGIAVVTGKILFGIDYWLGAIAIPLVFVFTLIAVNSTGLTSITPTGALGKLTQLSFSVLAPGNIQTNIMTAGITGEVAGNASNLLMDIKPGYMLGAKPRQQAVGHVLGIIVGALAAVPVFYLILNNDLSRIGAENTPFPGAQIWKAVAEVLTKGLTSLHPTAQYAALIGGILGIVIEFFNQRSKGKFPVSAMGLGLAGVLPFSNCWSMSLGAFIFWALHRKFDKPAAAAADSEPGVMRRIFVDNQETVCAGIIAGGSIMGIVLTIIASV